MSAKPSYLHFDKGHYAWHPDIDYRAEPELYRVGKGEQGVLICEPYKSEIGRYWRFKTEVTAKKSSAKIYELFMAYLDANDFVGADLTRKYLQMGYTRARRYANYKGGKKYDAEKNYAQLERGSGDPEKARAAALFYERWKTAEANEVYGKIKKDWNVRGVKKHDLTQKTCMICARPFSWQKKWKKDWEDVKYRSERCRNNKNK